MRSERTTKSPVAFYWGTSDYHNLDNRIFTDKLWLTSSDNLSYLTSSLCSHCRQKWLKSDFSPISDFFMKVWAAQIFFCFLFFSNSTQTTFICGPRLDSYTMFCNAPVMLHFILPFSSLKFDRIHDSALEEAGPGKIHISTCKLSMLRVTSFFFCACISVTWTVYTGVW